MAKGSIAKSRAEEKIISAFGSDFIAVVDKKIYVWADDDGERVQIAISMTCPKNFIGTENNNNDGMDFDAPVRSPDVFKPAEITPEETDNVNKLLAELGF